MSRACDAGRLRVGTCLVRLAHVTEQARGAHELGAVRRRGRARRLEKHPKWGSKGHPRVKTKDGGLVVRRNGRARRLEKHPNAEWGPRFILEYRLGMVVWCYDDAIARAAWVSTEAQNVINGRRLAP